MTTPRPRSHDTSAPLVALPALTTAVSALIAGACFTLALAAELWLIVIAIPSAAVVMTKHWIHTRWRLLPRMVAIDAAASADRTWDDHQRAALALALTANCNTEVINAAAAMIPRLTTSTERQRRVERQLHDATAILDHPSLSSLVPPPPATAGSTTTVLAATTLAAILWTTPTPRWWFIPLGVSFTILASALHDRIAHNNTTTLVAHTAIDNPATSATSAASPRQLAQHAQGQGAVLRRAIQLIADTPLPPDIRHAATEHLHQANAHT